MEEPTEDTKMKVTLSKGVWKYTLLFLDSTISIVAVGVMSFGVVALGVAGSVEGAYAIAALGSFILGICFWGFFASVRESHMLCISYIGLSVVGFILKFAFMIALFVMKDTFTESTRARIDNAWDSNRKEMNLIQSQYDCCGKDGVEDYSFIEGDDIHSNLTNDALPESCCNLNDCDDPANIFTQGCTMAALTIFEDQSDYFMLSTVFTVILKVFSVVAAYYFARILNATSAKTDQKPLTE